MQVTSSLSLSPVARLCRGWGDNGGLRDENNIPDVYAAGDVCTVQWDPQPQMWFQVGPSATFRPMAIMFLVII